MDFEMTHIITNELNSRIAFDDMVSQWGGISHPELSVLLVHLKFLATLHQTNHWVTKGDPFYSDHLMFARLYEKVNEEIDVLAEKIVGLCCDDGVNMHLQAMQVCKLAADCNHPTTVHVSTSNDLATRSMMAELDFLECVEWSVTEMKHRGVLTRGLDNLIAGMEDTHESHLYLLKRKIGR